VTVLLSILAASVVVFALLETLLAARERAPARHVRTDLAYVASDFVLNLGVNALRPAFPAAIAWLAGGAWRGPLAATGFWVQLAAGALLLEAAIWATHWAWHRFDALYPFHAVHHGSTHVWFLSGLRQHPVQFVADQLVFALLLTLAGVGFEVVGLLAAVQMVSAFLTHSNLALPWLAKVPGLKYVLCTPRFHILHHDAAGVGARKNLGGGLSLFDWLLGTALDPDVHAAPDALGSGDPAWPQGFAAQTAWPFHELAGKHAKSSPAPAAPEVVGSASGRAA
jgi:sterol desaturase/sphingolipid hydroxylase (fatty acid hydroxylase superfamily)